MYDHGHLLSTIVCLSGGNLGKCCATSRHDDMVSDMRSTEYDHFQGRCTNDILKMETAHTQDLLS